MKRRSHEQKYSDNIRKQNDALKKYLEQEQEWAENLLYWYGINKQEIPNDQYRACAFFLNNEYRLKAGSLTLLYETHKQLLIELPKVTKENAFDILCFRFKIYAKVLESGGYNGNGQTDI